MLASFWPHGDAQRCCLLRSGEQHSTRSAVVWAGSGHRRNTLRIRRLGVRVPPSAPRSKAPPGRGRGLLANALANSAAIRSWGSSRFWLVHGLQEAVDGPVADLGAVDDPLCDGLSEVE